MGSCFNKPEQAAADAKKKRYESKEAEKPAGKPESKPEGAKPQQYSWQKKKRDLSNFQFMNEQDKFLFKAPGSLNGQQFRIQGCKDCNLYVHDNHDQCFVDQCTNCVIVLGPCSSSTFIRDCRDCKVVVTAQQLRMRDCHNVEVMLFSQT